MTIERWNWQEREHREPFLGCSFVTIDPGAKGYALGWSGEDLDKPVGYCHALEPESVRDLLCLVGARVVVLEEQHIRSFKTANSVLDLSFRAGLSLGWTAAVMPGNLHLFQVQPPTWQAHQRRLLGRPRAAKGEALKWTLERGEQVLGVEREWQLAPKDQREGMASALGIAEWWKSLW